jgi:lipoprotein NlpI
VGEKATLDSHRKSEGGSERNLRMFQKPTGRSGLPSHKRFMPLVRVVVALFVVLAGQGCGNKPPDTTAEFSSAFARGLEANGRHQYGIAIADFSDAIRLKPEDPIAHYQRGNAYSDKGDYDKAIADFDQTLQLDPNHTNAYLGRGRAFYSKGEYGKAIADFDQAIRLSPTLSSAFFNRGVAHSSSRDWVAAAADFASAHQLSSNDAYVVLWQALVGLRQQDSGWAQRLEQQSQGLSQGWPLPLVRFYGGQLTADQVLAAANDTDAAKQQRQLCEASFYLGEWKLVHGQASEATEDLNKAQSTCSPANAEYSAAVEELKNLGNQ